MFTTRRVGCAIGESVKFINFGIKMSRRHTSNNYENLLPSEETIRNRIDFWDSFLQKYDRPETQEELDNAVHMCDLGEHMPEHEEEQIVDPDDSPDYEDSLDEEAVSDDPEFDVKKVLKILQPIIQKRIEFFETVCEEKTKKMTRTKDAVVAESKLTKKMERRASSHTVCDGSLTPSTKLRPISKIQSMRSNNSPATPKSRNAVIKSSNVVAITPIKTLSTPGRYQEEFEEVVTTTTVTTTTKKIRRVVALDHADAKTEHAKRKLSLGPIDEDDHVPKRSGTKNEVSRRKTVYGASASMAPTKKNRMSLLQIPSSEQSIVLYEPGDAYKYDQNDSDAVLLEPDDLNQAILNKSFNDSSIIDSSDDVKLLEEPVRLDRNETLFYQKGSIDVVAQATKVKSKVDLLQRWSALPCPKLFIKNRQSEK